jgi:hypothetical protein
MTQMIVGYDPGGDGVHGLALLTCESGRPTAITLQTLYTAEDVLSAIEQQTALSALGVDTLTCWGTGSGAWRPADRWLRDAYKPVRNSVVSPNALFGSMGLNGMSVLITVCKQFPNAMVTETHPKVLYWHLAQQKHAYSANKEAMDGVLSTELGIRLESANEHEWDAGLSALAALKGHTSVWTRDLHCLSTKSNERLITPCGPTHYFWPA